MPDTSLPSRLPSDSTHQNAAAGDMVVRTNFGTADPPITRHLPARLRILDRIFENHLFRKLYHMLGGGLLLGLLALLDSNGFLAVGALYFLAFLILGRRISFAVAGILLVLIFSGSKSTALLTTVIWIVGDGLAGLIGRAYGRRRWPWHPQKTLMGSAAFLGGASLAAALWLFVYMAAPPAILLMLSVIPSLAACLVETLPISFIRDRKPDDNLTVLLATGLVVNSLAGWLGVFAGR